MSLWHCFHSKSWQSDSEPACTKPTGTPEPLNAALPWLIWSLRPVLLLRQVKISPLKKADSEGTVARPQTRHETQQRRGMCRDSVAQGSIIKSPIHFFPRTITGAFGAESSVDMFPPPKHIQLFATDNAHITNELPADSRVVWGALQQEWKQQNTNTPKTVRHLENLITSVFYIHCHGHR